MMEQKTARLSRHSSQTTIVRKTILDFSYCMEDCIGEGYSSKVYKGIDDRNGNAIFM